jgi:hypothetical protein
MTFHNQTGIQHRFNHLASQNVLYTRTSTSLTPAFNLIASARQVLEPGVTPLRKHVSILMGIILIKGSFRLHACHIVLGMQVLVIRKDVHYLPAIHPHLLVTGASAKTSAKTLTELIGTRL